MNDHWNSLHLDRMYQGNDPTLKWAVDFLKRSQARLALKKGQDDREEMLGILYSRYIDTLQSNNCDETEEQGITRVENVALHHAKG